MDDYASLTSLMSHSPTPRHLIECHIEYQAVRLSHPLIHRLFVEFHIHGSWKMECRRQTGVGLSVCGTQRQSLIRYGSR